ncbi:glycosyl transferase [Synechocystis sp. LKSZ1]|uniref:glycosyl transferase n=1 Tax=Synechocystis sp. LKSZ1 TaxID=3144951 RepID=UPI00336BFA2A
MSRPTVYCAITGHGFGHAVRLACIANQIQRACPEVLLILASPSPRWLLASYIEGEFIHRPVQLDVGVIQADSLTMDLAQTRQAMEAIYQHKSRLVANEANYLRNNRVHLVLADIPALAVSIAHQAGVPCWMIGNFGWNFIYQAWGEPFAGIVQQIEQDYQACDRLFRLPLAEPMQIFSHRINVGLTGGNPRYGERALREQFNLKQSRERTVLLTFGGLGLGAIPYATLAQWPDWDFITFDRQAPALPNLRKIDDPCYRPADFMPLCGRVISKPGYSTFAEALRLEIPVVSLTREGFAEAPILLEGLQDYGQHQIVATESFFQGDWQFLEQAPNPPRCEQRLDKQGAETIATAVLKEGLKRA